MDQIKASKPFLFETLVALDKEIEYVSNRIQKNPFIMKWLHTGETSNSVLPDDKMAQHNLNKIELVDKYLIILKDYKNELEKELKGLL